MSRDTKIGIVTAVGHTEPERFYNRLHGLLEAIKASTILTPRQRLNFVVMGEFTGVRGSTEAVLLSHLSFCAPVTAFETYRLRYYLLDTPS